MGGVVAVKGLILSQSLTQLNHLAGLMIGWRLIQGSIWQKLSPTSSQILPQLAHLATGLMVGWLEVDRRGGGESSRPPTWPLKKKKGNYSTLFCRVIIIVTRSLD